MPRQDGGHIQVAFRNPQDGREFREAGQQDALGQIMGVIVAEIHHGVGQDSVGRQGDDPPDPRVDRFPAQGQRRSIGIPQDRHRRSRLAPAAQLVEQLAQILPLDGTIVDPLSPWICHARADRPGRSASHPEPGGTPRAPSQTRPGRSHGARTPCREERPSKHWARAAGCETRIGTASCPGQRGRGDDLQMIVGGLDDPVAQAGGRGPDFGEPLRRIAPERVVESQRHRCGGRQPGRVGVRRLGHAAGDESAAAGIQERRRQQQTGGEPSRPGRRGGSPPARSARTVQGLVGVRRRWERPRRWPGPR